ncbi:MAG: VPLPA-CTERM sorting domain-containing protein [Phycisphaerae bacterium]|nr:VPLPA-CTERM sorting domain-containing protein [Phycisphaerae bacterium]
MFSGGKKVAIAAALTGAVIGFASPAKAVLNQTVGGLVSSQVTADISFTYQSLSDTAAKIIVQVTNTTSTSFGGVITAWGFNVPTIAGVAFTSIGGDVDDAGPQQATALTSPNPSGWWVRYDPGNIKTPNAAGFFDFGVMNANSVPAFITDGTGSGIQIVEGASETYTFDIVGTGLDNLSNAQFESAFWNELSTGGTAGAFNFGVRFQSTGPTGGGSDLAVTTIPLPGAAWLVLAGLPGLVFLRRYGVTRGA